LLPCRRVAAQMLRALSPPSVIVAAFCEWVCGRWREGWCVEMWQEAGCAL
jgi:hypothetical protein